MQRTDTHPQHFDRWMIAAAHGDLQEHEKHLLADHLATCPECRVRTADPAVVEHVRELLTARQVIDAGLEARVAAAFRAQTAPRHPVLTRAPGRAVQPLRPVLALCLAAVIVLRLFNLRFYTERFVGGPELSTLWHGLMRMPRYAAFLHRGDVLHDQQQFLAILHKLTAMYLDVVLWGLLLLVVARVLIGLYRQRHDLLPQV